MTSIYPLGAVKPRLEGRGLRSSRSKVSVRVSGSQKASVTRGSNCRGSIGMRYATRRRCWVQLSMSPLVHPVLESSRI